MGEENASKEKVYTLGFAYIKKIYKAVDDKSMYSFT